MSLDTDVNSLQTNEDINTEQACTKEVANQPCAESDAQQETVPVTVCEAEGEADYTPEYKRTITAKDILKKCRKYINPVTAVILIILIALTVVLVFVGGSIKGLSKEIDELKGLHRGVYDKSSPVALTDKTERIYTYNYAYGEVAIPAIPGVPVSTYIDENFQTDENGFKYYYNGSDICSYVGIDVSEHNGSIDWDSVKDAGVDFVMLRIGGRGWGTEGVMYEDACFKTYLRDAKDAGLMVGGYFFSQAISAEEAIEEAEFVLDILDGAELDYPVAFDWETVDGVSARTDNISPDILTECARAFCDAMKSAGYVPCLYTSAALAYYKYDLAQLADVDIWYAFYDDTPGLYYNYMIWQYSDKGSVAGISGNVDLNICFKNYK